MQQALRHSTSETITNLPFADYAYPSKSWNEIVVVGEAPGAEEARLGRPFVGRSGQLLDKVLEKAGVDRASTLIANVFRYQPPANKVDHFFTSRRAADTQGIDVAERYGKFGSLLCREQFASELDFLGSTIREKRPKVVVALGRTPLWALTGENGLLSKVGQPLACRLAESTRVIATFHPSFILRGNWKLQDQWLEHLTLSANYL